MERREFVGAAAFVLLAGCVSSGREVTKMEEMYGLIGQMMVAEGMRGRVISILLKGTADMPGNVAYMVAEDSSDANAIWITEVWNTKTDHANSLKLPSVAAAIAEARPHIVGFGTRAETKPFLRG